MDTSNTSSDDIIAEVSRLLEAAKHQKYLTPKACAELLGVSENWLRARRYAGDGPPYTCLNSQTYRYNKAAVLEWMREREVTP